jgi:hypothetical protein
MFSFWYYTDHHHLCIQHVQNVQGKQNVWTVQNQLSEKKK